MPNPFADDGVSDADIEAEMESEEVLQGRIQLADRAAEYWRRVAPVLTGAYKDSIKVEVNGQNVTVGAYDEAANIIEWGSEDTPEFAPRAKVQAKFRVSE